MKWGTVMSVETLVAIEAPSMPDIDTLLACILERAEGDHAHWTMRHLEDAMMDAASQGEEDPSTGHLLFSKLLATLPLLCDANTEDGRTERFCRSVARQALELAEAVGELATAATQQLILETLTFHPAPSLLGLLHPLETRSLCEADRRSIAATAERLAMNPETVRRELLLDLARRMRQGA